MRQEIFSGLFKSYGKSIGLSNIEVKDNFVAMTYDPGFNVNFYYKKEDNFIYVYIDLDNRFDSNREITIELLLANYFWHSTNGATISVNPITRQICVADKWYLDQNMDVGKFSLMIDGFVDMVESWQKRLH